MAKSNCDNCVYSGVITGLSTRCCNYFLVTSQRRPCPPGEGCTVKVGREVQEEEEGRKRWKIRRTAPLAFTTHGCQMAVWG